MTSLHIIDLTPGQTYTIVIEATVEQSWIIARGQIAFKAGLLRFLCLYPSLVFNRDELRLLYEMAIEHAGSLPLNTFRMLYRCKPASYFHNVMDQYGGLMRKCTKDNSGHAASPINGLLSSSKFSTS
jgi:hypothetical protein